MYTTTSWPINIGKQFIDIFFGYGVSSKFLTEKLMLNEFGGAHKGSLNPQSMTWQFHS